MNNNKREELNTILIEEDIDILGITESWTHEFIEDAEISFNGYKLYRKDRAESVNEDTRGGGVLLYVKNSLRSFKEPYGEGSESIWIKLKIGINNEIVIGVCYRNPTISDEEETSLFDTIRQVARMPCIIMGDFNFGGINWELVQPDSNSIDFVDLVNDSFLIQNVFEPTRDENILDLVFCSEIGMVEDMKVKCPIANSDHNLLSWSVLCDNVREEKKQSTFNYDKGNFNEINRMMREINWNESMVDNSIDEKWMKFSMKLLECRNRFVPIRTTGRKKIPPFMNNSVIKKIKKRNKIWSKYRDNPNFNALNQYKSLRNQITNDIRKAKRKFEMNLADRIKEDPKTFYSYVRSKRISKESIGPLVNESGNITADNHEMGRILNKYFASVFTVEDTRNIDTLIPIVNKNLQVTLENVEITNTKIRKAIGSLKLNKAEGVDHINSTLLKNSIEGILEPLMIIYKESLKSGEVPKDWRRANVSPIFKKGSKKEAGNYRPVSLTCHAGKILEKILKEEIVQYLESNNLIYDSQHGFRQKRSCLTNLLEFMEIILKNIDSSEPVDVIFLDLQKAFDKVPHKRLILKLHEIGIRGKLLKWIESWLQGREQRVVLNGVASEWVKVESGVPQGSVLGPILFIIYINDLDENIKNKLLKFADDTKLLGNVGREEGVKEIQEDLLHIEEWADKWQMKFNADKCKVMHLGRANARMKYSMDGVALEVVNQEKDLGVVISEDLKVAKQCLKAAKKGNQILGLISRTFVCRERELIVKLYKTLVRPHLDYCIQSWRPYLQKDKDLMEKVQRRATRMISGYKGLMYEERLEKLKLTTLETRRTRADLLQVYKIVNRIDGMKLENFFEIGQETRTRGHSLKFFKKRFNTTLGSYSFGNRVVDEWNRLPDKIVKAASVNEFKRLIDNHLRYTRGLR